MYIIFLFDKKISKIKYTNRDYDSIDAISNEKMKSLERKSSEILAQARSILLEANISGASVKKAQELYKKALHSKKSKDYNKSIKYSMECIDFVDEILKNE